MIDPMVMLCFLPTLSLTYQRAINCQVSHKLRLSRPIRGNYTYVRNDRKGDYCPDTKRGSDDAE